MRLYLVQHGEAVAKEKDPERPLSARGKSDVMRIAGFLKQAGIPVSRILHSGKTRARQTAEILGQALLAQGHIEAIDGIAPNDPVDAFALNLQGLESGTMTVGHLPFLAKLAAWLVTADENQPLVAFQQGSVVCLEQDESDTWKIQWMVRPDCVPASYGG
ncbi:MAG: phosphohistidine phosphatase SixA [Gammaproteobacteria bacterium]